MTARRSSRKPGARCDPAASVTEPKDQEAHRVTSAAAAAPPRPRPRTGSGSWRLAPTIDLAYPFKGRWLTQNSPANGMPSHGTTLFATSFAIDFLPVHEAGRNRTDHLRVPLA